MLGILLIGLNAVITRVTSYLLIKAAYLCRRRTYEYMALHLYGPVGKTLVELFMTLFLIANLCAFFVVIGDLGPHTSVRAASAGRVPLMVRRIRSFLCEI